MKRIFTIACLVLFSINVYAQAPVKFTEKELAAAFTLMRPELNSIELDGRTGIYTPAPSIRYLGVERETFAIDLGWIANLADLKFNHIKAKMPTVAFQAGSFQLTVPLEDRSSAVQSRLGAISLKDVSVTAVLGWRTRSDQRQEIVLLSTRFDGKLSGSGVLRSSLILSKTRELIVKTMTSQIKKLIANARVQEAAQNGLLKWSGFYTGQDWQEITPGSLQFFNGSDESGLSYTVQ
jgi:hypothetical protein